jgi:hypothetical protein
MLQFCWHCHCVDSLRSTEGKMKGANEPENGVHAGDEELEDLMDLAAIADTAVMPESAAIPQPSPLPWIGPMPRSRYVVMAVVNEGGYLVPVCTAGDLLRGCKIIWQASPDES